MSKPVRCFSCGLVLQPKYEGFDRLTNEDGFSEPDALSPLQLRRKCCVRMVLTGVEINGGGDELSYEAISRFPQSVSRAKEGPEVTRGKRIPFIPHLGNYQPSGKLLDFTAANLLLTDESPLAADEPDELPNPVEWTERSRVLALIWFLSGLVAVADVRRILYLGCGGLRAAAFRFVLDLFEADSFTFTLIDRHDVDPALKKLALRKGYSQRLRVAEKPYTTADAKSDEGEYDALFCEYALADRAQGRWEQTVDQDMRSQLDWYRLIGAQRACLRLRIPQIGGTFMYPAGTILLAPWESPRNLDAYLYLSEQVAGLKNVGYSPKTQRQRMLHHDRVSRESAWAHPTIKESFGIDACWDCAAECSILSKYISATDPERTVPGVIVSVRELTGKLSYALDEEGALTLQTPPHPEEQDGELEEEGAPEGEGS
jgi:DNA-directed RNA polymerase I, II, and III subunit RPABC5